MRRTKVVPSGTVVLLPHNQLPEPNSNITIWYVFNCILLYFFGILLMIRFKLITSFEINLLQGVTLQ